MASDTNLIVLTGRLTHDPELSYTSSQLPLCKFSIATNRFSRNSNEEGKFKEEVSYFNITAWNKLAENCTNYLKKGSKILLEGYLKQDRFQDKSTGQNRSAVNITAQKVQFLDAKGSSSESGSANPSSSSNPEVNNPSSDNIVFEKLPNNPSGPIDQMNDDDDVPF